MKSIPQIAAFQAPWNDVVFDASATYPAGSREWFAQIRLGFQTKYSLLADQARRAVAGSAKIASQSQSQEARATEPEPQSQPRRQAEPQQKTEPLECVNGVLDNGWLYFLRAGRLVRHHFDKIESGSDILQLALAFGLRTVWVFPGSAESARATKEFVEGGSGSEKWKINNPQYSKNQSHLCTFLRGWKQKEHREATEDGREVGVGFAEHGDWVFKKCRNPVQMLGSTAYLEDAIGTNIAYSSHSVGRKLMEIANSKRGRKEWIRPIDIRRYPAVIGTADVLQWKRGLTEEEAEEEWIDGYDKNSDFGAGCTHAKLGSGEPIHIGEMDLTEETKILPGRYYIRLGGSSVWNGHELPHPTDGRSEGWFWSSTVQLAVKCGYQVRIDEGWGWEESHTILRYWATDLWAARCRLNEKHKDCDRQRYFSQEARKWAYESVKQIINTSIGLLAHPPENEGWTGATNWYRPDWQALIVDAAKCEMFRRIQQVMQATGKKPIGCDTDCLYYVAETADHKQAIPGMMDRRDGLGGFKEKWGGKALPTQVAAPWFDKMKSIIQINKVAGRWMKENG
jgi:hypothetical protein